MKVANKTELDNEQQAVGSRLNKKQKRSKSDVLLNIVMTLLIIMTLCLFTYRVSTGEAQVRGRSMENTLVNDEKLLYEKVTGVIGDYNKQDILILKEAALKQSSDGQDGLIVKRLIAKSGDTVDFSEDGKPIVNGKQLEEPYIKEQESLRVADFSKIIEKTNEKYGDHLDVNAHTVPDGYYFVMGDNRNNSSDSRTFGLFKKNDIVGHVIYSWTYKHFY